MSSYILTLLPRNHFTLLQQRYIACPDGSAIFEGVPISHSLLLIIAGSYVGRPSTAVECVRACVILLGTGSLDRSRLVDKRITANGESWDWSAHATALQQLRTIVRLETGEMTSTHVCPKRRSRSLEELSHHSGPP